MNKKVLIICAHPDDEAIGCAGTIKKYADSGFEIALLVGTDGEGARSKGEQNIESRVSSLDESNKILNIKKTFYLEYPDNQLDSIPLLEIVKKIEKAIYDFKPSIVFTHHLGDLNIDHQIIHKATMTACRPQTNFFVNEIFCYEVMSSTDWQLKNNNYFIPNVYVDITDHIKDKIKVLEIYKKEMREHPHARSIENIINNAKVRGATVGFEYAEAFIQSVKLIK